MTHLHADLARQPQGEEIRLKGFSIDHFFWGLRMRERGEIKVHPKRPVLMGRGVDMLMQR